ncbi:MAG: DedA family protein [Pseudomonadales bacterium]|jgi:membrane protein YqaA with SNARE-associated domain|nr:DedA family protein [Pseudomonadales bacterium]MBL6817355.1 DedA family protein [Pseudomonadales bacterium]
MDMEIIYLGLSAFLAATLVPVSSEIVFTGYLALGYSKTACLLIASIGNCLGTTFNYGLGVAGMAVAEKYFGFTPARHEKVLALNNKYGKWTLWLAWLPIIGDPITIYAGVSKTNFWYFALIVYGGRIGRYALILYALQAAGAA